MTLLILLAASAAGCGTAYRDAATGLSLPQGSGYEEEAGPRGLIKVTYHGNRQMLMYQVQEYTLYRCAEIAQRGGSEYFVLYQTLPDALQNRTSSDVKPTTILGIPHAEVYIGLRPAPAPGLLSTSDVLERLRPAIAAAK